MLALQKDRHVRSQKRTEAVKPHRPSDLGANQDRPLVCVTEVAGFGAGESVTRRLRPPAGLGSLLRGPPPHLTPRMAQRKDARSCLLGPRESALTAGTSASPDHQSPEAGPGVPPAASSKPAGAHSSDHHDPQKEMLPLNGISLRGPAFAGRAAAAGAGPPSPRSRWLSRRWLWAAG